MSVFLVASETINRVVMWLSWESNRSPDLKEVLEGALGIATTNDQWYRELGKAMFQLNVASVDSRYGKGEAEHFRERTYRYSPTHGTEIQVLKSLECWLYQCTEGEVVKEPLYQFFRTVVERHLMSKIIHDLPEYDSTEWG